MTKTFVFLRQTERSALSWGNVHWELWLRSQYSPNKPAGQMQRAGVSAKKTPFLNVPRGHSVSNFTKVTNVPAANLNIAALNVEARTPHCDVIFVAFQRRSNFELPGRTSTISLPAPIKLNHLRYFLQGYTLQADCNTYFRFYYRFFFTFSRHYKS